MVLSFGGLLGAFLDSAELVAPVAFETAGPFVDRPDCLRVRTIKRVAAVAPHLDQPDLEEHPKVFGDGGLGEVEGLHDLADRAFARGQEVEDVPPAGFGDRVKAVGGGGGAGHGRSVFRYRNMSRYS
jgi:hypothetical protein